MMNPIKFIKAITGDQSQPGSGAPASVDEAKKRLEEAGEAKREIAEALSRSEYFSEEQLADVERIDGMMTAYIAALNYFIETDGKVFDPWIGMPPTHPANGSANGGEEDYFVLDNWADGWNGDFIIDNDSANAITLPDGTVVTDIVYPQWPNDLAPGEVPSIGYSFDKNSTGADIYNLDATHIVVREKLLGGGEKVSIVVPGEARLYFSANHVTQTEKQFKVDASKVIPGINMTLLGSAQDDILIGGQGDDLIIGSGGADKIYGNGGNDELYGGETVDTEKIAKGRDGNDYISGGAGTDTIDGGEGLNKADDLDKGETVHNAKFNERLKDSILGPNTFQSRTHRIISEGDGVSRVSLRRGVDGMGEVTINLDHYDNVYADVRDGGIRLTLTGTDEMGKPIQHTIKLLESTKINIIGNDSENIVDLSRIEGIKHPNIFNVQLRGGTDYIYGAETLLSQFNLDPGDMFMVTPGLENSDDLVILKNKNIHATPGRDGVEISGDGTEKIEREDFSIDLPESVSDEAQVFYIRDGANSENVTILVVDGTDRYVFHVLNADENFTPNVNRKAGEAIDGSDGPTVQPLAPTPIELPGRLEDFKGMATYDGGAGADFIFAATSDNVTSDASDTVVRQNHATGEIDTSESGEEE